MLGSQNLYLCFYSCSMGVDLRVRRRFLAFMFFPSIVFLWFLGWVLYWAGSRGGSRKTIQNIDDGISIVTQSYEEAIILQD